MEIGKSMVVCDKCKKDFEMEVEKRNIDTDIEEHYFICPHCNEEYISFRTNSKTINLYKKIEEETEKYKKAVLKRNVQAAQKKWIKIQKLKRQYRKAMAEINQEGGL